MESGVGKRSHAGLTLLEANSILRNSGGMGGMRGTGGMGGIGGMGGMGGIGGMKFDFFLYGRYKTQVTQVRLNQRVFWVKDGVWGNGFA